MAVGILLINTGTPCAPTAAAIQSYLREFLMDPCIIGAPYPLRKLIVSYIAKTRPTQTLTSYQAFWTSEGSPFMLTSFQQRDCLQSALDDIYGTYCVELAMRYGNPSIAAGLTALRKKNCNTVILLPLYPQNVNVCAGTCFKEARYQLKQLAGKDWHPSVYEIPNFHYVPAYRKALAQQVADHWTYTPQSKLIVSFHSTMRADIKKDSRYLDQCTQTKNWLANDLGIPSNDVLLGFQSRFDSRAWLSPFTEQIIDEQREQGVSNFCIVCPGFVADNIETTIEIDTHFRKKIEANIKLSTPKKARTTTNNITLGEAAFTASPNVSFTYVPALGCHAGLIDALCSVIQDTLKDAPAKRFTNALQAFTLQ